MGKGGGGGTDNRGMGEAIVLLIAMGVVLGEAYFVFQHWWFLVDRWMEVNPFTIMILIGGLSLGPIAAFFWMRSLGKKVGDEAERIGREMRR